MSPRPLSGQSEKVTADPSETLREVETATEQVWGTRRRRLSLSPATLSCSFLVWDAALVTLTLEHGGVRVVAVWGEPDPGAIIERSVRREQLPALLGELDIRMRAALPARYLELIELHAGRRPAPWREPADPPPTGRIVRIDDVPALMAEVWAEAALTPQIDGTVVRAVVHGIPVAIERDAQYGVYTGAAIIAGRAVGTLFGSRLIARDEDESSVRELLRVIDSWIRLRRALPEQTPLPIIDDRPGCAWCRGFRGRADATVQKLGSSMRQMVDIFRCRQCGEHWAFGPWSQQPEPVEVGAARRWLAEG